MEIKRATCYATGMVTTILDKMLQPATDEMPPEFARKLLGLRADAELQSRIDELRLKANQGRTSLSSAAKTARLRSLTMQTRS